MISIIFSFDVEDDGDFGVSWFGIGIRVYFTISGIKFGDFVLYELNLFLILTLLRVVFLPLHVFGSGCLIGMVGWILFVFVWE